MRDVGVILYESLNFKSPIDYITAKARSWLAWIKRLGRKFDGPWMVKRLFSTFLMLPIVEYNFQIWNPYYENMLWHRNWSNSKAVSSFATSPILSPMVAWLCFTYIIHRLLFLQMTTLCERREIAQSAYVFNLDLYPKKNYKSSLLRSVSSSVFA